LIGYCPAHYDAPPGIVNQLYESLLCVDGDFVTQALLSILDIIKVLIKRTIVLSVSALVSTYLEPTPKRRYQGLKKRRAQDKKAANLRRRKESLFQKAHKPGKYHDVDVALIINQNGRFLLTGQVINCY
jgi:hypothetical protein